MVGMQINFRFKIIGNWVASSSAENITSSLRTQRIPLFYAEEWVIVGTHFGLMILFRSDIVGTAL